MNKNILRLAILGSLALSASAATLTKSGVSPAGFLIPGSPAPAGNADASGVIAYSITVPQITVAELGGASLIGVSYTITIGTYATYSIIDTNGNTYQVSWGTGFLQSPANAPVVGLSTYGTGPFGGSPAISIAAVSASTLFSGATAGATTTQQVVSSASLNDNGNVASYIGAGNVTFTFKSSTLSGTIGAATQTTPDVRQGARVDVVYTISDVPETSTYAAGAVVLLGAGVVARRRMAKA